MKIISSKIFNYILVLFITITTVAQDNGMTKQQFLPASPDAAALGKFGDVPVTMNTGIPNISVPFYEIKERDISLLINFSYNAGGIKVQQESSIVGLGWNLNAGGAITRIVRGLADDRMYSGFFATRIKIQQLINGQLTQTETRNLQADIVAGRIDAQPDLYIGNIGGLTFKFAMDSNGVFRTIPHSNTKIQYNLQLGGETRSGFFTVTDDNGNSYRFGGFISGEGSNPPVYFSEYNVQTTQVPHEDISAWYIREIKTTTGNKILFDYINSLQKSAINQSYTVYREPMGYSVIPPVPCSDEIKIPQNTYNPTSSNQWVPVLKKISWSQGWVEFSIVKDRTDNYTLHRLSGISVFNTDGRTIANCDLTQDYFAGANGGRLRLKKIQSGGMDFIDDISGELVKTPVYSFEYDDRPLPYIESMEQDHWGYYNASGNNHLTPSVKIYNPYISAWETLSSTANRNVNPVAVTVGMLKKITYPTGGSTVFEFESNTQSSSNLDEVLVNQPKDANGNFYCGGVRIKKITTYDPYHPDKNSVRVHIYNDVQGKSSGVISNVPVYAFFQPKEIWFQEFSGQNPIVANKAGYFVIHSSTQLDLSGEANHVYYKEVHVLNGQNAELGKTSYRYNFSSTVIQPSQQQLPFSNVWQQDWKNNLLKEEVFKSENNQMKLLSETNNAFQTIWYNADIVGYKVAESPIREFWTKRVIIGIGGVGELKCVNITGELTSGIMFKSYVSTVESPINDYVFKSREASIVYSSDNNSQSSSSTDYKIDPVSLRPSSVKSVNSEGQITEKRIKYSGNFPVTDLPPSAHPAALGLANLHQKNIKGAPVEETMLVNEHVVASALNIYDPVVPKVTRNYQAELKNPVPERQFQFGDYQRPNFIFDDRYKEQIEFTLFDNDANPVYQQYKDAHGVGVMWDYNNNLPVAEVKLGKPQEDFYTVTANDPRNNIYRYNFAYTSFEGTSNGYWQGIDPKGIVAGNAGTIPSGSKAYEISTSPLQFNYHDGKNSLSNYYLYFWKHPSASISISASANNTIEEELFTNKEGWKLMRYTLKECSFISISGKGLIDEVRLFTTDSRMSTVSYLPGVGIQCQGDTNGRLTYYYYDGLNRLSMVKDMEGNILKTYEYQFQK